MDGWVNLKLTNPAVYNRKLEHWRLEGDTRRMVKLSDEDFRASVGGSVKKRKMRDAPLALGNGINTNGPI